MMSPFLEMTLAVAVAGIAVFWWKSQSLKPMVLRIARQRCEQEGLQLLDQSVVLRRVRFKRDRDGRLRACRRYMFEFTSTGMARYPGYVELMGNRVMDISIAPHHI